MTGATIKVLYNDCYGGFAFSNAFLKEFQARTNRTLDTYKALFRLGASSIRCDPVAIAIFEEHGSEWCSGPNAALEVFEFPALFAEYWSIEDYDGEERVHVDVNAALADCLATFMDTRDLRTLERQYAAIEAAKKVMWRAPLVPAEPVNITPPVLKQPANIGPNEYGSYFDGSGETCVAKSCAGCS